MHPKNPYQDGYNLKELVNYNFELQKHVILNPLGKETIDFNSSDAVYALNKAILIADFNLKVYNLPKGYLIPPIPGRLDYLLHLQDKLYEEFKIEHTSKLRGLDIGSGANGIYCILGAQHFNWTMVGSECDVKAVEISKVNINQTKALQENIEIQHQENKSFLFKDIIKPNEKFDFTVCNPPFHSSKDEALKGSFRKLKNLGKSNNTNHSLLNFEGQANELWCNGGESLFIKRLIKESVFFKNQVKVFTSLVAKAGNLQKIEKQLKKSKADYKIVQMSQGQKKSRFVMWWF